MFKKILLMTVLCHIVMPEKAYSSSSEKEAAAIIVAGAGVLGTIVYWAQRESNDSVVARAKACIRKHQVLLENVKNSIEQKTVLTSAHITVQGLNKERSLVLGAYDAELLAFQQELAAIGHTLAARYNSYVKPWNWSAEMKQELDEVQSVLKYINELLYQYVITYVAEFNNTYGKLLDAHLALFLPQNNSNLINKLVQEKNTILACTDKLLLNSSVINSVLSSRSSKLEYMQKNMHIERDFAIIQEQAQFLNIVLKYSDHVININQEAALVKEVRKLMGTNSSYPIKDFIYRLECDISILDRMEIASAQYVYAGKILLRELKNALLVTNEYIAERRAYELYLEQQRQTRAAQEAALAAQQAAWASQQTVWATQERNRIERERNRIAQERNNIERSKQQNNNDDNNRW